MSVRQAPPVAQLGASVCNRIGVPLTDSQRIDTVAALDGMRFARHAVSREAPETQLVLELINVIHAESCASGEAPAIRQAGPWRTAGCTA